MHDVYLISSTCYILETWNMITDYTWYLLETWISIISCVVTCVVTYALSTNLHEHFNIFIISYWPWNTKHETRSMKHETWYSKHESRNTKWHWDDHMRWETRNTKHEVALRWPQRWKHESWNTKHELNDERLKHELCFYIKLWTHQPLVDTF